MTTYECGTYLISQYLTLGSHSYFCPQLKLEMLLLLAESAYYKRYKTGLMSDLNGVITESKGFRIETDNSDFYTLPVIQSLHMRNKPLDKTETDKLSYANRRQIRNGMRVPLHLYRKFSEQEREMLNRIFQQFASYQPATVGEILDHLKDANTFQSLIKNRKEIGRFLSLEQFHKISEEIDVSQYRLHI